MNKIIYIDNKFETDNSFLNSNLSYSELKLYDSKKTNKARYDFLIGRIALKKAYESLNKSKKKYNLIDIKYKKSKAPYINNNTYCSISHSNEKALCAISSKPIGVDIELIKNRKIELLEYICVDSEIKLFKNKNKLTQIWSIKEAVLKALETGFKINPKEILIKEKLNNSTFKVLSKGKAWIVYSRKKENFFIAIAHEIKYWNGKKFKIYRYK